MLALPESNDACCNRRTAPDAGRDAVYINFTSYDNRHAQAPHIATADTDAYRHNA